MNIFDGIGKTTFDVIKNFAGYNAKWTPLESETEQNAIVLYKGPTGKFELNENKYDLEKFQIEFYESDFVGFFDSVQDANNEKVSIELSAGVFTEFFVKRCERKYDGKSIIAFLTPVL